MPKVESPRDVLAERVQLAGKRVIDVGSGAGELVRWLRAQGADVTGVECGVIMRQRALEADPEHPECHVDGVAQDLPFDDESADVITFCYSLHHVPREHLGTALSEAARVLREDGILYVLEPVAAGAGHQVDILVDDETEVRAHAQAALIELDGLGFAHVDSHSFFAESVYRDVDEYESIVVGIDPTRAGRMDQNRAEVGARLIEFGEKTDQGYRFHDPIDLKVYRKRR